MDGVHASGPIRGDGPDGSRADSTGWYMSGHAVGRVSLFLLLMILPACLAQVKKNAGMPPPSVIAVAPTVIKSYKAVGMAPDFDTTLVSQYIRSIFQDSKGNLWFGTISEGVVRYDVKTLRYFSGQDGFQSQSVFAINEDGFGNLWFGTDQGVYRYDGVTFRRYAESQGLRHIDISRKGILIDRSGGIWVGTHGGVYKYDPDQDRNGGKCFSHVTTLSSINVAGMLEDKAGNIWVASSDKGVFRYDGKSVVNFKSRPGLGGNYAGGMAQDKRGDMWFIMQNGFCRFDGEKFTDYTSKDGLGGSEFWGILIERSGIIWVTARGSTTRFDPAVSLSNPRAFTVFTVADGLNCCVQSMYEDRAGRVWWGTGQGLYRFDGRRFYQVRKNGPW